MAADTSGPEGPAARGGPVQLALAEAKRQLQDPPADEREDRRQEGDRREDRGGDHHRGRVAERLDQWDAAEVEAEEGGNPRPAGEDDRRARAADGARDRFVRLDPLLE